jgi:hypothetical protein
VARVDLPMEREPRQSLRRRLRKSRAVGEGESAAAGEQASPGSSETDRRRKHTREGQSNVPRPLLAKNAVDAAVDSVSPKSKSRAPELKPVVRTKRSAGRRSRRRQGMPALMASTGFNCLVLVLLLAGKLPGIEPLDELLWSTAPPLEEVAFSEVDFETPNKELPMDGDDVADELIDPGMASFGELESAAALANVGDQATLPAGSLGGDMGALFGESGAGLAKFDDGLGGAPTARFFGQEIEGRRIVFVLDNSGSMQNGRLETVIAELLRCIDSLRDDQEFYVIFHSDTVYPLFYPDPVDRYLRPTKANKRMLARWLDSVELCLGDSVDEAIAMAAMIEPDTVFLLSDGRIQGNKTIRFLLAGETRNFPIHTFAVGMGGSVAGRRNLEEVAAANGGEFRESEIPDEMRDLARREMRPYHSELPGLVWGRHVKPFRPRG